MTNLEYLKEFFRKHSLSGRITVDYDSPEQNDDGMKTITFENGDIISIDDVIFDIISDFPSDVFDQWMKEKRVNDISLHDWIRSNNHYIPDNIDKSGFIQYQKEMEDLMNQARDAIDGVFTLIDDGSEDYDEDDDE